MFVGLRHSIYEILTVSTNLTNVVILLFSQLSVWLHSKLDQFILLIMPNHQFISATTWRIQRSSFAGNGFNRLLQDWTKLFMHKTRLSIKYYLNIRRLSFNQTTQPLEIGPSKEAQA